MPCMLPTKPDKHTQFVLCGIARRGAAFPS